jgi:hypothetical protein
LSAVLVLCGLPVHADRMAPLEADAFRLVNALPSLPFRSSRCPMQLDNFLVVTAAVVAALALRRWGLAGRLGPGRYRRLCLGQSGQTLREARPAGGLLDDVVVRGAEPHGFGYVSATPRRDRTGVVAWALAAALGTLGGHRGRAAVFVTRMYVGAHLPLDMGRRRRPRARSRRHSSSLAGAQAPDRMPPTPPLPLGFSRREHLQLSS